MNTKRNRKIKEKTSVKNNMGKVLLRLVSAVAVSFTLTACLKPADGKQSVSGQNPYYPENEIITTENLYDDRMVIVIDTQYNVSSANIGDVVEAQFPEVNVLLRLQNTADSPYFTQKSLEQGQLGDIFFCAVGLPKDEEVMEKYFVDLSYEPFISNFYQNALDSVAINGKIYMLPGFADLYGIVYDRTLFEEHGWELPGSRDEFIALCRTIQEEEGYQAFMPTLKYGRMAMMLSHAFHYESMIAGMENQQWLRACRVGEANFAGHIEPMFEGMKELFDAGVLSLDNFTIDPGIRSAMLYKEYTTAMTMENQSAVTFARNTGSSHEYGMMPFWGSNDPNSDYIVSAPGYNIYVNKQLENPENEKKLEKVIEILAYFSTPEGQNALMAEGCVSISNVKGTEAISEDRFMEGVADTIAKGNIFQEVRYTDLAYNNPVQVAYREALIGYVDGTMNLDEAVRYCDEAMQAIKDAEEPKETVYGTATEDFTVLETAEFVADILREEADADIALVLAKHLTYGEPGNFYEGDITDISLKMVSLDYVSGKVPEYNRLVTVNLTGEQILAIMNYPYLNSSNSDTRSMWVMHDNPCYWVPSNMKIEYAPLLTEHFISNAKNMDGSEFDLAKTYKVAIWNGCFSNLSQTDYFDEETLNAMENVTIVSDKTSIELIKEKLAEEGEISPPSDGRFLIRWDMIAPEESNVKNAEPAA